MITEQHETLKDRLEKLDRRVAVRKGQLKHGGAFLYRDGIVTETRRRQAAIKRKIDAALANGSSGDLIKAELELELSGVFLAFLNWEERLDAETVANMKND